MHFRLITYLLFFLIISSCTKKEVIYEEPPLALKSSVVLAEDPETVWTSLSDIFFERYEYDVYLMSKGIGKLSTRWIHYIENGVTYKFQMNASVSILKEGVVVSLYKHIMRLDPGNQWIAILSDQREEKEILAKLLKKVRGY